MKGYNKNNNSTGLQYSRTEGDGTEWMIEKDSMVLIENNLNNITVRAEGIALGNADFMEKVKVKNLKSGKVLYGFVQNKKKIVLNTKQN